MLITTWMRAGDARHPLPQVGETRLWLEDGVEILADRPRSWQLAVDAGLSVARYRCVEVGAVRTTPGATYYAVTWSPETGEED